MKNNDQTTQDRAGRSFAQEMQQAFADWVRKLPFMKRNIPEDPDQESSGDTPSGRPSAPHPGDGVRAGEPPGNKKTGTGALTP